MRFRLYPTLEQEKELLEYCAQARFIWNLAVEQNSNWRPGRASAPGYLEKSRQLTEIRKELSWLSQGSYKIQQQALRDFDQAMKSFFKRNNSRPTFRKRNKHESFGVVDVGNKDIRRLSCKVGEVRVHKLGWVRFRWSRYISEFKSYRIALDRSGRWHVSFKIKPCAIDEPHNGKSVGVDLGVNVSFATSEGELHNIPKLTDKERRRLYLLQRKHSRSQKESNRREKLRVQIAKINARKIDRKKDFVEKLTTDLARKYDTIGVEDLKIKNMTKSAKGTAEKPGKNIRQKSGLNSGILSSGWGLFTQRLEDKATNSVIKVNPRYTSQKCSSCGYTAKENRESQAIFHCKSCGYQNNADVNGAINIKQEAEGLAASALTLSDGSLAMFVREATIFSEQWWKELESNVRL